MRCFFMLCPDRSHSNRATSWQTDDIWQVNLKLAAVNGACRNLQGFSPQHFTGLAWRSPTHPELVLCPSGVDLETLKLITQSLKLMGLRPRTKRLRQAQARKRNVIRTSCVCVCVCSRRV